MTSFYFSDMKNEGGPSTMQETGKRKQHCTFCKNHGELVPKNGHKCEYKNHDCILCDLTRRAQKVMCYQQRLWRHQKNQINKPRNIDGESSNNGTANGISAENMQMSGLSTRQVCSVFRVDLAPPSSSLKLSK